jgi:hypothetical protein
MGWDFVDASAGAANEDFVIPDNDPMDRHGHGTHVAGIAGATADNAFGIMGVAWGCRIMPVRAGYKTPTGGGFLETDDAAQAIVYAAENGAKVINLSWGGYHKSNLLEDALTFATDKGAIICAAAGNEKSSNFIYPAASEINALISVGATDDQDKKASFSNYGSWVDLSAPGAGIYSTGVNNTYYTMSGTSMAAPCVSGLAALVFSHFDSISPIAVKTRIMRSVDVLSDLTEKNSTSGRINAYAALTGEFDTPYVFSLNPTEVYESDELLLLGDAFGDTQGDGKVRFYPGKTAEIISWSDSAIVCRVPENARSGDVTVETSKGTSNGAEVTVLVRYYEETLIENEFKPRGQAQGWKADDQSWLYQLPFSFRFFGEEYDSVYVCSNGFLDFKNSDAPYQNSTEVFKNRIMIAPLWDDLISHGISQQDEDIYIYSPSPDSVSIRWTAERYETGDPVNVEVVLYEDGRIKFNYGSDNTNLSPTIGLSGGDGTRYHLSVYDDANQLDQIQTVLFTPDNQTFTIDLDLGWNLISLPLEPKNNQVSQIFKSIASGINCVWGYLDSSWKVYVPGNPKISNLAVMKQGYGYWVETNQKGLSFQIQGRYKSQSFDSKSGWNLIGLNFLQPTPADVYLLDIGGEYEIVWGYKEGAWKVYDPQNPSFSDLKDMKPGRGYWVKFGMQ